MTMTMKPKHILALGLLALGLGSCGEGFFEQYPSNNITEGNFYKTDDDFNQGVVACYAKLKTQMGFHLTAYTLLAKVYLTFGKPAEAKTALEEAMKNTSYGLESTTKKVFDVGNKMNREIIFALYYNKTNDNGHGYWYSANTEVLADIRNPTPEFKAIYDGEKDNRLPLIGTYTKISSNLYAMTKWYDTYDATYTTQVGNDFPHLRYADVVLMYAEALAESGGSLGDALEWLNKTRTRAGLDELTTDEVKSLAEFRRELAAERGREFALEGHRWFDLVRLGLAVDYFREMGYSLDSHNLIFPIPQNQIEIVNNPSILWQNPGFN